jgi:ketosteroid isomerase-like protein
MSQENVEVIRRSFEAVNRGDMEALAALMQKYLSPEFEYQSELAGEVFSGVEGARAFVAELHETFQDFTTEVEEAIDSGEHVVVVSRQSGRGAGSGVPTEWWINTVWTFDGGSLVRGRAFSSRAEALKAVGLRE